LKNWDIAQLEKNTNRKNRKGKKKKEREREIKKKAHKVSCVAVANAAQIVPASAGGV
jgi:hypothetical protein